MYIAQFPIMSLKCGNYSLPRMSLTVVFSFVNIRVSSDNSND